MYKSRANNFNIFELNMNFRSSCLPPTPVRIMIASKVIQIYRDVMQIYRDVMQICAPGLKQVIPYLLKSQTFPLDKSDLSTKQVRPFLLASQTFPPDNSNHST